MSATAIDHRRQHRLEAMYDAHDVDVVEIAEHRAGNDSLGLRRMRAGIEPRQVQQSESGFDSARSRRRGIAAAHVENKRANDTGRCLTYQRVEVCGRPGADGDAPAIAGELQGEGPPDPLASAGYPGVSGRHFISMVLADIADVTIIISSPTRGGCRPRDTHPPPRDSRSQVVRQ